MDTTYKLLSPYHDEELESKKRSLVGRTVFNAEEAFVTSLAVYLVAFTVGFFGSALIGAQDLFNPAMMYGGGSIAGVYTLLLLAYAGRDAVASRALRKLDRDQASDYVEYSFYSRLHILAGKLDELQPETRAELRPLWDSALAANQYMLEVGQDEAAIARIQDRIDAVDAILEESRELELTATRDAALARYGDQSDDDLRLARVHAEALRAGREAYSALGTSS